MRFFRVAAGVAVALAVMAGGAPIAAQAPQGPITVLTRDGRKPLPVTLINNSEYLPLDEVAAALNLTARDDRVTGATTLTLAQRSAVLTADRTVVSVQGRLVSLAAPPLRQDNRLFVTPEFVTRAAALLLEQRIEFRRAGRLLVVGDLRVPRVVARAEYGANAAEITLEAVPAAEATVALVGGQLSVAFAADALDVSLPNVPAQGQALLQTMRAGETPGTIVLVPGPRFATHRATTQLVDASSTRVSISLMAAGAEPLNAPAPAPPPAAPGTPAAPGVAPPDGAASPGGFPLAPAIGVRTVVIDAGHGGDANGTAGPGGTLEKTVTLAVSRKLKALIESRLGLRVVMTREDDRTLDQDQRAAIANNNRADLLISIHANAAVRPTTKGAEVYYLSVERADLETRRRAEGGGLDMPQLGGGSRAVELILWDAAQSRHIEQSLRLAGLVEAALRTRVEMSPRAVQQAPFRVLVGANMPAVLVELGYLSNPDEEKALTSGAYQDKLALSLLDAITKFREAVEKPAAQ